MTPNPKTPGQVEYDARVQYWELNPLGNDDEADEAAALAVISDYRRRVLNEAVRIESAREVGADEALVEAFERITQ